MTQYIDQEKTKEKAGEQKTLGAEGSGEVGQSSKLVALIINVIHGMVDAEAEARLKAELRVATKALQVMSIVLASKKLRRSPSRQITFNDSDLDRLTLPHNDALVVSLQLKDCTVRRILVDQGSSVEVIYYSLFKDMGLSETDLQPCTLLLIGFSGALVWPLSRITLSVTAGTRTIDVEFVVVKVPSPYNAIVGRNWLHKMEIVALTYHQVVRFIGRYGQEVVLGDQVAAKACYVFAIRGKIKPSEVQIIEQPEVEEGKPATEKAVEDLVSVPVAEGSDRYFLEGFGLTNEDREEIVSLLRENIEAFAWTPHEMPGVDPNFISHHLNVDENARPIM